MSGRGSKARQDAYGTAALAPPAPRKLRCTVPFGCVVGDRKLVIHEEQAATVRMIFERFAKVGSATTLAGKLAREGVLTPRGKPIDKGFLYKL